MRSRARTALVLGAMLVALAVATGRAAEDPVAAERQYRLAQRLGAEGSPDAPAAFEKVVALAPSGPLADDALVDLAHHLGAPDWPEELGRLDATRARLALAPLKRVVAEYASSDRVLEASYRLALIRIAPLAGRDVARARQDLLSLAADPAHGRFGVAGRYALGVLDEEAGAQERAEGVFARMLVEQPDSDVAPRASAGLGRTLLAQSRFGEAAERFQEAIEGGAPEAVHAVALRELAVREVLRERMPANRWSAAAPKHSTIVTTRGASLIATAPDGRVVVFDRKSDALQLFDGGGSGGAPTSIADVTALATDSFGRVFAATKDALFRWDPSGLTPLVRLLGFGAPRALAVDAWGSIWIADRKGDRIARFTPGANAPVVVRERKGAGVSSLIVAGSFVIAAEEKPPRLVAIAESGSEVPFGPSTFKRPIAMSADAAGRIVVLDAKAETITRLTPRGQVAETLALSAIDVSRPLGLASAPDGSVRLLDGATGAVIVIP